MHRLARFFVFSSILFICGCGEDSSPTATNTDPDLVVGTWIDSDGDEWTFNADGTFLDYDGDEGTWAVDGDKMTWTYMDIASMTFTFSVGDDVMRLSATIDGAEEREVWKRKN
ncbi:MAG: hypothetical protein CME20_04515 [Gemmatimonadetes bacterium]|nr:hypothetical protein [Gemmatimonadota bacterium]